MLGARFAFAIDPDRLNEAGVVWASAVRKCAEAMAPMIRNARLPASSANARDAGEDELPAPESVNIIELGTGTGALGIALASIERTRVFVTDLEIATASYERQVDELVAEDEDTAAYVRDLETEWDDAGDDDLEDDPELLVAEVEEFLRDVD